MSKELILRAKNSNKSKDYHIPGYRIRLNLSSVHQGANTSATDAIITLFRLISLNSRPNPGIVSLSYDAGRHILSANLTNGQSVSVELQGIDGKSALDLAREATGNSELTYEDWIASLKGQDGLPGTPGQDGTVITGITGAMGQDNNFVITITTRTGSIAKSYTVRLPMPANGGGGGTNDGVTQNDVTLIFNGNLDSALLTAYQQPSTMFQYILQEIDDSDEEPVLIEKLIWHVGNGRFIDALGYVLHDTFTQEELDYYEQLIDNNE